MWELWICPTISEKCKRIKNSPLLLQMSWYTWMIISLCIWSQDLLVDPYLHYKVDLSYTNRISNKLYKQWVKMYMPWPWPWLSIFNKDFITAVIIHHINPRKNFWNTCCNHHHYDFSSCSSWISFHWRMIFSLFLFWFYCSYEKLGEQLEPKEGKNMETSGPQMALWV